MATCTMPGNFFKFDGTIKQLNAEARSHNFEEILYGRQRYKVFEDNFNIAVFNNGVIFVIDNAKRLGRNLPRQSKWKRGLQIVTCYSFIEEGTAIATFNSDGKFVYHSNNRFPLSHLSYAGFFVRFDINTGQIHIITQDPSSDGTVITKIVDHNSPEGRSLYTIDA